VSVSRFFPGHPPLRIDRVESRPAGPGWLAVTAHGRREAELPLAPPVLVIHSTRGDASAAPRRRPERFPATSPANGAGPSWWAAFTIPDDLEAELAEGGELEIGSLLVPLPGAERPPLVAVRGADDGASPPADERAEAEALARLAEARARAAEATRRRAALEREAAERIRRLAAERDEARAALLRAEDEIAELRVLVERLEEARAQAPPDPGPVAPVTPPAVTGAPWVRDALRRLASRDPAAAGEVVLALLPAQHLAVLGPLTYVVDLDGRPPDEVRVTGGRTFVGPPAAEGDAPRVRGDVIRLADLATGRGPWARLRARGKARKAIRTLGRAPLSFTALDLAGVEMPARLAYRLLAAAVPPSWTAGHAFTLAQDGCLVAAGQGGLLVLPGPAAVPPAAEVTAPPSRTLGFLLGRSEEAQIDGHVEAAQLLQAWTQRLEAGETPRSARV
jgi:hypothetical protein